MSIGVLFKVQPPDGKPGEPAQLLFSGARIPRETFRAMTLADNVLREAEAAAARLREQAEAAMASQRQQAHEQGFAQGRVEAIAAVLGTLEVERRLRELLSHRLASIVEQCMRSLLGELGESQVMRQRIVHLLNTASLNDSLGLADPTAARRHATTLYVCPAQLEMAQAIAAELGSDTSGGSGTLAVVPDEHRMPDALLLETRAAFIESDLTLTLREARELVRSALAHAMQIQAEGV